MSERATKKRNYKRRPKLGGTDFFRELTPEAQTEESANLTLGSGVKLPWICPQGHPYEAKVKSRASGRACPYCAGKKIWPGFNDVLTRHPTLAMQWDYERNTLDPRTLGKSSNETAWWRCSDYDHAWQTPILKRTHNGYGCLVCAGKVAWPGFNDLASRFPEVAQEFAEDLNGFSAQEITYGSKRPVWWRCTQRHEWQALPNARTAMKSGCPYCEGRQAVPGETDIFTVRPELREFWDAEANGDVDPESVSPYSHSTFRWRCPTPGCARTWEAAPGFFSGCVVCNREKPSLEDKVEAFIRERYQGEIRRNAKPLRTAAGGVLELDLWLPELHLAFEIQDYGTHSKERDDEVMTRFGPDAQGRERLKKGPAYHKEKRRLAREQLSLTLVDIWEDQVKVGSFQRLVEEALAAAEAPMR